MSEELSVVLKRLLHERNLSQRELARRTGVSTSYIAALLGGTRRRISMDKALPIARELNVSVETLTGVESPAYPSVSEMLDELKRRCEALDLVQVRVIGVVPSTAEVRGQYTPTQIELPRSKIREEGGSVFALEVAEALSEEGIDIGDYVVVAPDVPVDESGKMFVIEVEGSWTLARVRRAGSYLHVRPQVGGESSYPETSVTVIGRAVLGGRWREL